MAIAQSIVDGQARLNAALAAVDAKVTALQASQADPNAATPAEQQQIADALTASAVALEVISAR